MEPFKNDVFESDVNFTIEEASGDVNGKSIIGKIKGTFFVPNGKSRNKRWYSDVLWERAIARPQVKERLKDRRMIGTISHEQPLNDTAILEGKISHITTHLEVKPISDGKKQGYGEALILNTPAGQILKTFAEAGVKLFTSSRAKGKFKGQYQGIPAVDPDEFFLESFDFVLDPGFIEANPSLVESLKESIDRLLDMSIQNGKTSTDNSGQQEGDETMADKEMRELLESSYKENGKIKADLQAALNDNEDIKAKNVELSDKVNQLEEDLKTNTDQSELIEKYKGLGTPEEIIEALKVAKTEREQWKELGTFEETKKAIETSKVELDKFKELGTPEELDEAIKLSKEKLDKYDALGTVEEITEAFDLTDSFMKQNEENQNVGKVKELAEELGVPEESVSKMYKSMNEEEIRTFFKDLGETKKYRDMFRKPAGKKDEEPINENKSGLFEKTAGERLMESVGR